MEIEFCLNIRFVNFLDYPESMPVQYSVIKTIFHGGHVFVTTISRVSVKNMFMCFGRNLMCMMRMKNNRIIA